MHDYHLIPMAISCATPGCSQRMGFFLHIPWPALEVFLALPNHRDIVKQMCAYDMLGFQTERTWRISSTTSASKPAARSSPTARSWRSGAG